MKKIFSVFAGLALLFTSCDNGAKFHVEGTIEEAEDQTLLLEACTLDGIQAIDSVKLSKDGKFAFKASAPTDAPEFYILRIGNDIINFSVDSTETITITAKRPTMSTEYTVAGSDNSQKIKEIALLQQDVQKRIIAVENNQSMYPGDITDSVKSILESYKETIKTKYIYPDPAKACAYYAVCQNITDNRGSFMLFNPVSERKDVRVYATVATAWDGTYPEAARTQQLCNMAIKGMDNTAQPTQRIIEVDDSKISETGIIDIELPDINSKMRKISTLKGKVVLLDFTLYGAKESPERTRTLRSLYSKYSAQGFEIYQVSLDDDIHFWKSSVEHLPWICVHETDGRTSGAYGISKLPTFFVIDRNNEIVVRSDFMEGTLEDAIMKLL